MGDHLGLQSAFFWSALVYLLTIPAILTLPGKVGKASDTITPLAP